MSPNQDCFFLQLCFIISALPHFRAFCAHHLFSALKSVLTHLGTALSLFIYFLSFHSQVKIRHSYRFECFELLATAPVYYVLVLHTSQRHACPRSAFTHHIPKHINSSYPKVQRSRWSRSFCMTVMGFFLPKFFGEKTIFFKRYAKRHQLPRPSCLKWGIF